MPFPTLFVVLCALQFIGSSCRSISVVVKHRHTFAVEDIKEKSFIQLPKEVEAELRFEPREATTENNYVEEGGNKPSNFEHQNSDATEQRHNFDGPGDSNDGNKIHIARHNESFTNSTLDNENKHKIDKEINNDYSENGESLSNNSLEHYSDNTVSNENNDENDENELKDNDENAGNEDMDYAYDNYDEDDDDDDEEEEEDDDEDDDYLFESRVADRSEFYNENNDISTNRNDRQYLHDENKDNNYENSENMSSERLQESRRTGAADVSNVAGDLTNEEEEISRVYALTERKKRDFLKRRKRDLIERQKRQIQNRWNKNDRNEDSTEEIPDSDIWEDVTDEELEAVQRQQYFRLAKYIGWTLLSVSFFVLVGICFLRDPMTCIFSFGTGCPCFLIICPCVRAFMDKYLNIKQMVQDAMNKYTPGVIVNEDGSIQHYEPTAEEVAYLKDLLDEITGQTLI